MAFESAVASANPVRVSMASRGQRGLPVRWDPPSKCCSFGIWAGEDGRIVDLAVLCHPISTSEAEMLLATNLHQQKVKPGYLGRVLLSAVAALAIGVGCSTAARAQNEAQVKAGLEVWKSSGCADCHGPFANGDKERDEAPTGADIRTARLDAAALKLTISCGRPGGAGMPAFDEGAYKVRPCYNRPLGPPPDNLYPTPAR